MDILKKKLKQYGWTYEKMAAALDCTSGAVSQIVNGNPTIGKLQEIANIIGCPVTELITDNEEETSVKIKCPKCGEILTITVE